MPGCSRCPGRRDHADRADRGPHRSAARQRAGHQGPARCRTRKLIKTRAKALTEGDWAAKAVKDAIDEVATATAAAAAGAAGASGGSYITPAARAGSAYATARLAAVSWALRPLGLVRPRAGRRPGSPAARRVAPWSAERRPVGRDTGDRDHSRPMRGDEVRQPATPGAQLGSGQLVGADRRPVDQVGDPDAPADQIARSSSVIPAARSRSRSTIPAASNAG